MRDSLRCHYVECMRPAKLAVDVALPPSGSAPNFSLPFHSCLQHIANPLHNNGCVALTDTLKPHSTIQAHLTSEGGGDGLGEAGGADVVLQPSTCGR
jgi:hypothetical protein